MRKHKIPLKKVQKAFNDAIKRRDCKCRIKDDEPCCGSLECSHCFAVGSNPSLRFYPPNAYAQCSKHHWNHHNRKESESVYRNWMFKFHSNDLAKCEVLGECFIRYDDELKAEIIRLCKADRLNELTILIEREAINGF